MIAANDNTATYLRGTKYVAEVMLNGDTGKYDAVGITVRHTLCIFRPIAIVDISSAFANCDDIAKAAFSITICRQKGKVIPQEVRRTLADLEISIPHLFELLGCADRALHGCDYDIVEPFCVISVDEPEMGDFAA